MSHRDNRNGFQRNQSSFPHYQMKRVAEGVVKKEKQKDKKITKKKEKKNEVKRQKVLEGKLDTIKNDLRNEFKNQIEQSQKKSKGEIEYLKNENKERKKEIGQINHNLSDIDNKVSSLRKDVTSVGNKVTSVQNEATHIKQQLNKQSDILLDVHGTLKNFMKGNRGTLQVNPKEEEDIQPIRLELENFSSEELSQEIKAERDREETIKELERISTNELKLFVETSKIHRNKAAEYKSKTERNYFVKKDYIYALIDNGIAAEDVTKFLQERQNTPITSEGTRKRKKEGLLSPNCKPNTILLELISNSIKQFNNIKSQFPIHLRIWLKDVDLRLEHYQKKDVVYAFIHQRKIKYIGSTARSLEERALEHIRSALKYKNKSKNPSLQKFHKALITYGIKEWIIVPVQFGLHARRADGKSEILQIERALIRRWRPKFNYIKAKPPNNRNKRGNRNKKGVMTRAMTREREKLIKEKIEKENLTTWIDVQSENRAANLVNLIRATKTSRRIKGKQGRVDITNWGKLFRYGNTNFVLEGKIVDMHTIISRLKKYGEIEFEVRATHKDLDFKVPKEIRETLKRSKHTSKSKLLNAWSLLNKIKNKKLREITTSKIEQKMKWAECYIPKILPIKIPFNKSIQKKEIRHNAKGIIVKASKLLKKKTVNKIVGRIRVIYSNHKSISKHFHNHIKRAKEYKDVITNPYDCDCENKTKHLMVKGSKLKISSLGLHPKFIPYTNINFDYINSSLTNQVQRIVNRISTGNIMIEMKKKYTATESEKDARSWAKKMNKTKSIMKKKNWVVSPIDKNGSDNAVMCNTVFMRQLYEAFQYYKDGRNFDKLETTQKKTLKEWKEIYILNWKELGTYRNKALLPYGYFLPKEKDLYKSRPIVSYFNHPIKDILNKAARALSFIVQQLECLNFNLYKATDAVKEIKNNWSHKKSNEAWILKTFDIKEMFTNLKRECINQAINWLFASISKRIKFINISRNDKKDKPRRGKSYAQDRTNFSIEDLKSIIDFDLDNAIFSLGEVILKQKKGIPMGSPLSPILAQLTCIYRENIYLGKKKKEGKLNDFRGIRYMDDLMLMIKKKYETEISEEFKEVYFQGLTLEPQETASNPGEEVKFLSLRVSNRRDGTCRIRSNIKNEDNLKSGKTINRFISYKSKIDNKIKISTVIGEMHRLNQENPEWEDKTYSTLWLWKELRQAEYPKKKIKTGMWLAINKISNDEECSQLWRKVVELAEKTEKINFGPQTQNELNLLSKEFNPNLDNLRNRN